jgi:chaperonin GroES
MGFIQAVEDRIVVEICKKENKTNGGIVIPESVQLEPQLYGEVVSVGKDVKEVKENDIVAFHERAGMDFVLDQQKMKTLSISDIYGIFKE